jgi:hypothetical protein
VSNKLDQQGKKINLSSSFSSQFSRLNSSSGKDNKNPVNTTFTRGKQNAKNKSGGGIHKKLFENQTHHDN